MRISPVVIGFPVEICRFTVTKVGELRVENGKQSWGRPVFFMYFSVSRINILLCIQSISISSNTNLQQ